MTNPGEEPTLNSLLATPLHIESIEGCKFYHVMELPGVGLVGHNEVAFDLRPTIDAYLGHVNFQGKRSLDVGSASGYLTFEMERRGAEVVSLDLDDLNDWDLVPFADRRFNIDDVRVKYRALVLGRVRAFWFAHRLLGSRAQVHYGNIYSLPNALGRFDIAMLGMVLGHVRDPFAALRSVARLVDETIIITEEAPQIEGPYACFMPDPGVFNVDNAWWATSEECKARMMAVLGFEQLGLERIEHRFSPHVGQSRRCSTQVFRRVTD